MNKDISMKFGAKDRFFNGPDVIGGLSKTDGQKNQL
jgi:hypothetical protein